MFKIYNKYVVLTVLLLSIISVAPYIQLNTGLPVNNTFFWWIAQVLILFIFFKAKNTFCNKYERNNLLFISIYLSWNFISCLRGIFIAQNYWDWKNLIFNSFGLLLPISTYMVTNPRFLQLILFNYIKYILPLFTLLLFFIDKDAYGFYLVPISFLIIFLPVIKRPWQWIIIVISIFVILSDLGARSTVIKFLLPYFLLILYYFKHFIPKKFFEIIRIFLFVVPFVFFVLAITHVFNLFNMDEYIKGDYVTKTYSADGEEDDLKSDTRTFLYVEVLQTAEKYNDWLIGRSPARGNESDSFGETDPSNRNERIGNEVAILNIFTWTGILGILCYFLIFYHSSYLAINESNNIFSKLMGLSVAFRWIYAWVEDVNIFNLTTFFLWILIGFCYSKSFRLMTNAEIKYWVLGIFDNYSQHKSISDALKVKSI